MVSFCCSEPQVVLLVTYALYIAACLLLWRSRVLLPLKLFTVFLHELGHASAAWLTCSKVSGIEVHANQGGLTHWSTTTDRIKCVSHLVLPAGYLGSALWGGLILVFSVRADTAHFVAFLLLVPLTVALGYSFCGTNKAKCDWTLPILAISMIAGLSLMLYMCYFTELNHVELLLSKSLLLIGTMNTLFATYDIWEDTVSRTVDRSDASKYAELVRCATPKCIGVIWLIMSLALALGMLLMALIMAGEGESVTSLDDFSEASLTCMAVPAMVLVAALSFRCLCSKTYGGKLAPRKTRGIFLSEEKDASSFQSQEDIATDADVLVTMTTGSHTLLDDEVSTGTDDESTHSSDESIPSV